MRPLFAHPVFLLVSTASLLLLAPANAGEAVSTRPEGPILPALPIWPVDGETITDPRPTLRLNGRRGATGYKVELTQDRTFRDPIVLTAFEVADAGGIAPSVLVRHTGQPLNEGEWFWRCFASGADGTWTLPANDRSFRVAREDRDAIKPRVKLAHPRLLVTQAELAGLQMRLERSSHLARGRVYLTNAAYSMLEVSPPDENYARSGEGQHAYYNAAAQWYERHLQYTAYMAFLTGDEPLARKAVEMLMAVCSYERWLGPLFDDPKHFDPPWHSALETAMTTDAVAIAYDLLFEKLSEDQRRIVREALVEKGIRPLIRDWADPLGSSRLPRHQVPTGNWVAVCAGAAGVGALAVLDEHPEAPQWAKLVRNRLRAWLRDRGGDYCVDDPWLHGDKPVVGPSRPNFGRDGGYKESISYMNYGMQYVCSFGDALRRITGENIFAEVPQAVLDPVAWNALAWPTGRGPEIRSSMFDLGDCGDRPNYAALYSSLVKHRQSGLAAWLYHRTVPAPLSPRAITWYDESVVEVAPAAPVPLRVFRDIGEVVLRAGWGPLSPAAAIKFHQNRGHHDLGTFCLFGGGGPTIIDSGVTAYGSPIYQKYSSQSVAHNVVLVDGQSQARTDGQLLAALATSEMSVASGQLSAAYPGALASWTRDLILLPHGGAIVFDRLEGRGAHQFDLLLHPDSPCSLTGQNTLAIGPPPARAYLQVDSDVPVSTQPQIGYRRYAPLPYFRFGSAERQERQSFVTFCRWARDSRGRVSSLQMKRSDARWRGDIEEEGERLAVRLAGASDGRVATDARVAVVYGQGRRNPRPHALLLGATALSVDGKELLRATAPVDAAVEFDVPLRMDLRADAPVRVTVTAHESIGQILVDGRPVDGRWHEGTITLELPAGESRIMGSDFPRPLERPAPLVTDDLLAVTVPEDAPAFRPGVLARSSTCGQEGLQAIDGDPNSAWSSLPGAPMPQWLEVVLPQAEPMSRINVETGQGCRGAFQVWDESGGKWVQLGRFRTRPDATAAAVLFRPTSARRIRVNMDAVDTPGGVATVHTLNWFARPAATPAPAAVSSSAPGPATTPASSTTQSEGR